MHKTETTLVAESQIQDRAANPIQMQVDKLNAIVMRENLKNHETVKVNKGDQLLQFFRDVPTVPVNLIFQTTEWSCKSFRACEEKSFTEWDDGSRHHVIEFGRTSFPHLRDIVSDRPCSI